MKRAAWITLIYGILVLAGGIMGHIKAASTASLIMGGLFGILLIICSFGIFRNQLFPAYVGMLLTFLLTAFFTYRYLITYAFFPAGIMSLISLGVLIANIVLFKMYFRRPRRK